LTEEEYLEVGDKKAPMFKDARPSIYKLFLRYLKVKQELGGYDIMDAIKHIYDGITADGYHGIPFHNVTSTNAKL